MIFFGLLGVLSVNVGKGGLVVFEKFVWFFLRVETQAEINIYAALHVRALVHHKVLLFVISAILLVYEWRDPDTFRSNSVRTPLAAVNEATTTSFNG